MRNACFSLQRRDSKESGFGGIRVFGENETELLVAVIWQEFNFNWKYFKNISWAAKPNQKKGALFVVWNQRFASGGRKGGNGKLFWLCGQVLLLFGDILWNYYKCVCLSLTMVGVSSRRARAFLNLAQRAINKSRHLNRFWGFIYCSFLVKRQRKVFQVAFLYLCRNHLLP